MRFLNTLESTVFLAVFFSKATGYQILQFLVGAKTKHLLATTDCVALFQPLVDLLEKLVETKELVVRTQNIHQFIGDVIRKAARESRPFSSCHNAANITCSWHKSD